MPFEYAIRQHKTKEQPAVGMQSFGHDYSGQEARDRASAQGQSYRRSLNLNFSKWLGNLKCHGISGHLDLGWHQVAAVILRA